MALGYKLRSLNKFLYIAIKKIDLFVCIWVPLATQNILLVRCLLHKVQKVFLLIAQKFKVVNFKIFPHVKSQGLKLQLKKKNSLND